MPENNGTCGECEHVAYCGLAMHIDGCGSVGYSASEERECPARIRERKLEAVLKALVNKIDAVHDHSEYRYIWEFAFAHGHKYTGPQYTDELDAARELMER